MSRPWLDTVVVAIIAVLVLMAVFGPLVAPHDPYRSDPALRLLGPSSDYWLGTDEEGRDVLSRLLVGARPTLLSALVVVAVSTVIGILVASVAALGGRWVDEVLMRACDILLSLPGLMLALAVATALGSGLTGAIIALIVAMFPATARLARGTILRTLTAGYVEAARVQGSSKLALMLRHVLPNSLDEVLINATLQIGGVTLIMSGLSFIGVGAQPPSAEWGAMASTAARYVTVNWPAAILPGLLITVSVVAFGLLGDMLQIRRDPTLRKGLR
ncbi:ABC transporter permease [Actinoplanes sp. OR16]|uniref:ABC transporter permease n=1 Tax=Actinoplanes sp. OR16 TaxID=946334 RepID=UPI00135F189D|nr:ABC transporter permease [Actinoplanes sp. OR16]